MADLLDATVLRRSMDLYAQALEQHRAELDSINVFPVPDGDTGTNMLLTQRAVVSALASMDAEPGLAEVGDVIARASLLGARGNSGVILSQVLRGLCDRLSELDSPGPADLAGALRHASNEALRAVAHPRDGTVLSVLDDAAGAAERASGSGGEVIDVIVEALAEARRSVERTREILPELREAGVIDAGGKGMVLLLDAVRAALTDGSLSEPVGPLGVVGLSVQFNGGQASDRGFEVQCLLEAREEDVARLRAELATIGDSLAVVGGGGLYNVHVHTDDPDAAVDAAGAAGRLRGVTTVRLQDRTAECIGGRAREVRVAQQACGLVTAADGAGLEAAFRSLGAVVVKGPSATVGAFRRALEGAPAESVVLLAIDSAEVAAARRAADDSSKQTLILEVGSVPAGLAAATAFNPLEDLEVNVGPMKEAADSVRDGAVVAGEGFPDSNGMAWIGLAGKTMIVRGTSAGDVATTLALHLAEMGEAEIVTLVHGAGALAEQISEVAAVLRHGLPHVEVQVIDGGQPGSPYLIGVE